jgi:hypothetical protein
MRLAVASAKLSSVSLRGFGSQATALEERATDRTIKRAERRTGLAIVMRALSPRASSLLFGSVPLDLDRTKTRLVIPRGKEVVTLRLDIDVLGWSAPRAKATRPASTRCCGVWYETELLKREWERERRKKTAPGCLDRLRPPERCRRRS